MLGLFDTIDALCDGCFNYYQPDSVQFSDGLYRLEIPLPGFSREHLSVSVEDDILLVVRAKKEEKEKTLRYSLNKKILDLSSVKSTMAEGLLTITISEKKPTSRSVPVD